MENVVNEDIQEKMELVQDMSSYADNQKVKHTIVLLLINRVVAAMESTMIQSVVLKAGVLTNKAIRNGSIKKNLEKSGNGREQSKDSNVKDEIRGLGFRFSYEIEITSGQLVEIDKVIKGCKLEIEGQVFDINLMAFRSGSFDVIIGMDWLSNHKVEIICHKKVVRIPLPDGKVLRVIGEKPEEKVRHLFLGHVINGDGIHVDPSKIEAVRNWESLRTLSEENAFQTLKDKLCNAPVLALPDGPKDFVLYCDASGLGLGGVLIQIEIFSDYDYEIRYHPNKDNIVADALSRKERLKPKRGLQRGLDEMIELRIDGALYCLDQIWVPLKGDVRTLIMNEFYKSNYYVHPRADKMYYDLKYRYWWPGIKKNITVYISKCLTCLKVKAEHQRLSSLLQQLEIPEWKREGIAMDFVIKLPRTISGYDTIWVIMDRLTKSAHILPMREDYKMDRLTRLYLNEIVARDGVPISIISDRDSRNCRSLIMWAEVGEGQMIGPKLVQETTEKISQIKDRLKATRVVRFMKKGKLAPRFVGPFEIIEKVGLVAYRLDLPEELNGVHDTFHVSILKKCLADLTIQVPFDEIRVNAKLNFIEEPMTILEREFKKLKRSRMAIVKVHVNVCDWQGFAMSCVNLPKSSAPAGRPFSNRAATGISLGKMKEVLGDCLMDENIDPGLRLKLEQHATGISLGKLKEVLGDCLMAEDIDPGLMLKLEQHGNTFKFYSLDEILSRELTKLPYLRSVDLAYNYLGGTTPPEWGSARLQDLSILGNRISGEIPLNQAISPLSQN
nr:putative reverse transcriptase domain, ribonuclease H-like domain, aspartic peptidase domain protein [Tanacetum cinerariifolium]